MSTPTHIPVLHALEAFLKGDTDGAIQFTLTKTAKGELILSTFPDADGVPIEEEPPTGNKEVGETLRMIGRRIVREDEADGRRAA